MRPTNNNEGGSTRGDSTVLERCIILDSSAIFHIRDPLVLTSLQGTIFITNKILEELKDPRALAIVDILNPEKIEISDKEINKHIKEIRELSEADISVIICAELLKNKCKDVIVVTDDMKLSRILKSRGVKVVSIYFSPKRRQRRR